MVPVLLRNNSPKQNNPKKSKELILRKAVKHHQKRELRGWRPIQRTREGINKRNPSVVTQEIGEKT